MKKLVLASLVVVGWLASISTFAYQGTPGVENKNPTDLVRHENMEKAVETSDYAAWKELMAGKWVLNKITTEAQFKSFLAMKSAYEKGDTTTYTTLKAELWLWQKNGSGTKQWLGKWQKNGSGRIAK